MISGVYVPLLTAFGRDGRVDPGAFAAYAQWQAGRGVDGLVPFGTSGEGPSLSMRERLAVLAALADAVPGTPLVPAIMDSSLDAALEFVAAVNDMPAAGILVLPPYYFRPLEGDNLRRFVEPLIAASNHAVLLYHIPQFGPPVPPNALTGLPLWGLKDSGGDLAYTRSVLNTGLKVMVGSEQTMVEAIGVGAAGAISGLANLLPEHLLAAYRAARDGQPEAAAAILAPALRFQDRLISATDVSPVGWISAAKRLAQHRSGVDLGGVRPPVPAMPDTASASLLPDLEEALAELAHAGP